MPLYKAVGFGVFVVVLLVGGVMIVRPSSLEAVPVLGSWSLKWQGLTPAQTPREALDKFQALAKKRDYKHMLMYVSGPYAEELKIGADPGTALAKAVDDLNHTLETFQLKAEKVTLLLGYLEPLAADIKILNFTYKDGDTQATATLIPVISGKDVTINDFLNVKQTWSCDPLMLQTLMPGDFPAEWNGYVEVKKEASGWKVVPPVTPRLRQTVVRLRERYGNYVRFLDRLKSDIKNDKAVVSEVENELKKYLRKEAK